MGVILESGADQYRRTGLTMAMCSEKSSDAFPLMYDKQTPFEEVKLTCPGHANSQLESTPSLLT